MDLLSKQQAARAISKILLIKNKFFPGSCQSLNIYMDVYSLMDMGQNHDEMKQCFKNNKKLAFIVTNS